jgi:hypothetical protein
MARSAASLKEARQHGAKNEGGPLAVNGKEPLLNPATNGIFVNVQ